MYYIFIFLVFSFVCYGATELIVYMRGPFAIMEKFRSFMSKVHPEFGKLLDCEYCSSTWVSYVLSTLNILVIPTVAFTPFNLILGDTNLWWLIILMDGLIGSSITWMLFRIEDALTAIKEGKQNHEEKEKM